MQHRQCVSAGRHQWQQQWRHTLVVPPHLHSCRPCTAHQQLPAFSYHPAAQRLLQQQQRHLLFSVVAASKGQQPGNSRNASSSKQPQEAAYEEAEEEDEYLEDEYEDGEGGEDDEYAEGEEDEYLDDEDEGWEGEEEEEWEEEWEEEEEGEAAAAVPAAKQIPQAAATVEFTQDDFVDVGLISRPHGLRGEVKVQLITDEPRKRLGTRGKRLWLQALPTSSGLVSPSAAAARQQGGINPFKTLRRVVVQSGRVVREGGRGQRTEWAVKFEGIDSREQAVDLAGHKLLLALCDREARPRDPDAFFVDQLVGCKALDASHGTLLGLVTEVYETGSSYSLLRVRLAPEEADIQQSRYRSVLVPFVSEMVPEVDVAGGQLRMSLPEGLLETASSSKLKKPYTPEQQAQLRAQLKQRQAQQEQAQQQAQQQQQPQEGRTT